MASFYDDPSIDELSGFPPVQAVSTPPPSEKTIEFSSPVADLRLRRRLEADAEEIASLENKLSEEFAATSENIRNAEVDLSSVFVRDTLIIQPVSDLDAPEPEPPRRRPRPLNIGKIEEDSRKRLELAAIRGRERAKRRHLRYQHSLEGDSVAE
jgi:hypothetical protein